MFLSATHARPRDSLRRAVVWFLGFLATGFVFHDVDAATLREVDVREAAFLASRVVVVAAGVAYFALVIPRSYALGLLAIAAYASVLRASMFVVQWAGVRAIEARQ